MQSADNPLWLANFLMKVESGCLESPLNKLLSCEIQKAISTIHMECGMQSPHVRMTRSMHICQMQFTSAK